jgi:Na+-driven multidrug efflux pump
VLAAWYLSRSRFIFDFRPRSFRIKKEKMAMMVRLGIPSSVQSIIVNISFLVMTALVNTLGGVTASAAVGVVGKFNSFAILPAVAMSSSVSAFAAQNIGAGKRERVREGLRAGLRIIWGLSLVFALCYFFLGEPLVRFFIDAPTETAVHTGVVYLKILAPFYFVVSAKLAADGVLRGAKQMKRFMIATFTDLILRVVLAILLSKTRLGATGIWCAWPIGWTIATVLSLRFCLSGPAKKQ